MATSSLPSRGPKIGRNCNVTYVLSRFPRKRAQDWAEMLSNPCVLGGPQERGQNQKWVQHACLLGGPKLVHNPCVLGGPHERGQNHKWQHHPWLLGGPRLGEIATQPLCSRGSSKEDKIRSGYIILAFSGAQDWAEELHALRSRKMPEKGTKSEVPTSPLPSRGPKIGRNCYLTLAFSRLPRTGVKLEVATSSLLSRGLKIGRNSYITTPFTGLPRTGGRQKETK